MKEHYRKGGLGDSVLKGILNDTLQNILSPIREKRASISNETVMEILISGSQKAREIAQNTLKEVKEAIGLLYK